MTLHRATPGRLLLAAVLTAQFAWCEADVWRGRPFTVWFDGPVAGAIGVALVYGTAITVLLLRTRTAPRFVTRLVVGFALLFTVRFHAVRELNKRSAIRNAELTARPAKSAATITAFLREMSAAQEQYRLHAHAYAASLDSLARWMSVSRVASSALVRHGDGGWAARASLDGTTCSIWVRDSSLRTDAWRPEGAPSCGPEQRLRNRRLHSVFAAPQATEQGFRPSDVRGTWEQHRANGRRSGIASTDGGAAGPYRWTTRIGGDILASVAVAGNQLFVGAHGNGEFDALTLDSGKVGFRIRAPDWIHHEPVVTPDLVIVAFGNNERNQGRAPWLGSNPSGVVAYDRRTGVERWRRATSGSVMTSPVFRDSIVAIIAASREAIGWRASDGTELWRTTLPSFSPMGNPMLLDTLMYFGLERSMLCALDVRTGRGAFCRREDNPSGWGGGHASVASDGRFVYHVSDQGVPLSERIREGRWGFALASMLRLPGANSTLEGGHQFTLSEQALLALDPATGKESWRVRLGIGPFDEEAGHIAGTPTIADGVVYVPSPVSGRVYAVRAESGRALWWADLHSVRGSVLVTHGAVLVATRDTTLVVLDATTGHVRCRQRLPGMSDRAGPTLAGQTGILSFRNGLVVARPIGDWLSCRG